MEIEFNKQELLEKGVTSFHLINFAEQSLMSREIAAQELTVAPQHVGRVRQYFHHGDIALDAAPKIAQCIAQLERYFKTELKKHLPRGFAFNEVRVQRYIVPENVTEESGISRHRDEKKYQGIIVLLVIEDGGSFLIHTNESKEINAERGYCIVMKGSNFKKNIVPIRDTRLKHSVENVVYPRTTIALRFDASTTFWYRFKKFFQQ